MSALDTGTLVANLKNRQLEPDIVAGLEDVMCLMNLTENDLGSVGMVIGFLGEAVGEGSISTIYLMELVTVTYRRQT